MSGAAPDAKILEEGMTPYCAQAQAGCVLDGTPGDEGMLSVISQFDGPAIKLGDDR